MLNPEKEKLRKLSSPLNKGEEVNPPSCNHQLSEYRSTSGTEGFQMAFGGVEPCGQNGYRRISDAIDAIFSQEPCSYNGFLDFWGKID